jgi:branched-chain amino acid transport system permease protein
MKWVQLLVTGIAMGSIYALVALGYVTIYRASKVVNMAQGSFVMLGTFFCYSFLTQVGLPYWLAAVASLVGVMIVSVAIYVLVIRPIMQVSLVAMIMATVGLSILFENLTLLFWKGYAVNLPPFTGDKMLRMGRLSIAPQSLWVIGVMIVVFVALSLFIRYTRLGKQMTATATNPSAALLCGVSGRKMVNLAFMMSAAVGAIGGITMSNVIPVTYMSGGTLMLSGFVAGILGGWGSSGGAVVGGLALGILQSVAGGVLPLGYQDAVAFGLLIVVLYLRPQGLMGTVATESES